MKAKKKNGLEVLINACHGGFGLSDAAVEECIKQGMTVTKYGPDGNYADPTADFVDTSYDRSGKKEKWFGNRYHHVSCYGEDKSFRTNPTVIAVVKKLKEKANGVFSKLKIVTIPFEDLTGWQVSEYDGYECIEENHRTWG
jgi:hypothetical protein